MSNNVLPDLVNLKVEGGGSDSYFDLTIYDTDLTGTYNSWCVDFETLIETNVNYTANVYSSYETIPAGLIERPENLDLVNWIINQDYISRGFVVAQIQDAIWQLVESDFTTTDSGSLFIINEASANGEGFIPAAGDDVAVIFAPQVGGVDVNPELGSEAQTIIGTRPVLAPGIDVEKYVSVDGGVTWHDADTPTGPLMLNDGSNPLFKFVVTNTGEVDLSNITLTDSDFDLNGAAPGTAITIDFLAAQDTDEYIFTGAEWQPKQHANTATVTAEHTSDLTQETETITDSDDAHYFGADPAIDIEKFTNGEDADTTEDAVGVAPGETVTWTYLVTNTGNIAFNADQVKVIDDLEGVPTLIASSDVGNDGILSPEEVWKYEIQGVADNFSYTIDFDTHPVTGQPLAAGTTIKDLYESTYGLTISTQVLQDDFTTFETDWGAMIFDTNNPGARGNMDLGTPHQDFGGPGNRSGGAAGTVGENSQALNNVLILPEDNDPTLPTDNKWGGTFRFDWAEPVNLDYVDLLDIDNEGNYIQLYDADGNPLSQTPLKVLGDNSYQRQEFSGELISRMDVVFQSTESDPAASAAIAAIGFDQGFYRNNSRVWIPDFPGVEDSDPSHYTTARPGIDIEKSTNGVDADTRDAAVTITPGAAITWDYVVTNTGNVPFDYADVVVTDDQGLVPMLNFGTDAGGDRRLSPGETWTYQATGVAENLAVTTAVNLDFETNGSGVALNAGDIIDDEFQDAYGLTISAPGHPHGTMIFDSANPTGDPDDDLGTPNEAYGGTGVSEDGSGAGVTNTQPLGNVLILSQDGDASDPNDDKYGGTFRFEWDEAVQLNSMDLLDIEKPGSQVTTYDAEGNVVGNYLLQALGDNSFQTLDFQNEWITRMDVTFASADGIASGAIASVDFSRTFYRNLGTVTVNGWEGVTDSDWSHYQNEAPLPTRQPIAVIGSSLQMPAPASIAPSMADLATSLMLRPTDLTLRGTEAGDRLTGESGDDTLRGLAGNDRLLGRQGQDTLLGGAGNDLLNGGHGNDRIGAGAGDDVVVVRQGRDRIATGNGDDVIAIGGDGFAIVTDFQMGQDSLRLLGSASQTEFADLTLLERNNGLLVRNDSSNIAYLAGLDTSEASAVLLG